LSIPELASSVTSISELASPVSDPSSLDESLPHADSVNAATMEMANHERFTPRI
jgi:hypothetical protein